MPDFISRSEAAEKGLNRYYDGRPCKKLNHDSERYVGNGACVECQRVSSNKSPQTKADLELMRAMLKRSPSKRTLLSGEEAEKILTAFAQAGSYEHAAAALGLTVAQLSARRAVSIPLDEAFKNLERKIAAGATAIASTPGFQWTDANRAQLVERYIDTGDIGDARDAIGVSPSAYHRELSGNSEFAQMVADATPLAKQHLKERAIQLSLKGNDRLLQLVLKAEYPEFRDSLKVDVNNTVRHISDSELDRRLARISRGHVIDATFTAVEPTREIGAIAIARRETTESSAE